MSASRRRGPADLEEDGGGARGGARDALHDPQGRRLGVGRRVPRRRARRRPPDARAAASTTRRAAGCTRAARRRALARADDAHRGRASALPRGDHARRRAVGRTPLAGRRAATTIRPDEQRPSPFIELLPRRPLVHEERRADAVGSGAARATPPDERAAPAAPPPLPPPCTLVSAAFAPRPRCTGHDIAAAIVWEDRPPLASQDEADVGTGAAARRRVCVCGLPRGARAAIASFTATSSHARRDLQRPGSLARLPCRARRVSPPRRRRWL